LAWFAAQLLDLLAQLRTLPIAFFSLPLGALGVGLPSFRSAAPCFSSSRRLAGGLSFSFFSAVSSISSCMTRRLSSSSSCGIESISVRIMAQASSTRSIALSGRKRSVM
jgi:hypothetical protein